MTQNDELEVVKRRIRLYSQRTVSNGCTEAEANQAIVKIGELLSQFNLSMSEVMLRSERCIQKSFDTKNKHRDFLWGGVAQAIAKLTGTHYWFVRTYSSGIKWEFFGLEPDVEMAIYLCSMLTEAYKDSYQKYKDSDGYKNYHSHRRTLNINFKNGFGNRLYQKITEVKNHHVEAEKKAADYMAQQMKDRMITASDEALAKDSENTTGTALIRIEKEKYVESEFKKKNINLKNYKAYSSSQFNSNAYESGKSSADKVNLQRPLATRSYGQLLLK